MKKVLIVFGLLILISLSFVFALSEVYPQQTINPQQTKSLNSKNGVCEYYQKEFSIGEQERISINGIRVDIEYLGDGNWKINNYKGELRNHGFFTSNQNSKLKGVRFDFSFMADHQPDGNFGLTEQDYYPWDCQGYSSSTGMISEINVGEGWNLVPMGISLRDCNYALQGELCKDDVLVMYYYIPELNEYKTAEDIEREARTNQAIEDYFDDETNPSIFFSSKWIYVKPGSGNKKVIGDFGAYIPYRNQYLTDNSFELNKGWNFIFVDAFMVYDDDWQESPLSLSDMEGECDILKAYGWDNHEISGGGNWDRIELDYKFSEVSLGSGFVVKVSDDCYFGLPAHTVEPPPVLP